MYLIVDEYDMTILTYTDTKISFVKFLEYIYKICLTSIDRIKQIYMLQQLIDTNIVLNKYTFNIDNKCIQDLTNTHVNFTDIKWQIDTHLQYAFSTYLWKITERINSAQSSNYSKTSTLTNMKMELPNKEQVKNTDVKELFSQFSRTEIIKSPEINFSLDGNNLKSTQQSENKIPVLKELKTSEQQVNNELLEDKMKLINDIVLLSQYDLEKRKEEYEVERIKLSKEFVKLNNEKNKLKRAKEKEEEKLRMFQEGKNIYFKVKRKLLCADSMDETNNGNIIPEQFVKRYVVYKELEEEGLLHLEDEYKHYLIKEKEKKVEQYLEDKKKYYDSLKKIDTKEMSISDLDPEYRCLYDVFSVLDSTNALNNLLIEDEYTLFLETYADLLDSLQTAKYGLDTIDYLQDTDTGPVIKVVDKTEQNNNPSILNSSIAKTLGVELSQDEINQFENNSNTVLTV
jgi:hypothetical protein